jgi:hypothetical protein
MARGLSEGEGKLSQINYSKIKGIRLNPSR